MQRLSPPLRQRHLAQLLRDMRADRDLTLIDAVARLRPMGRAWSRTKLSRIETGETLPTPGDLADLLDVYEVSSETRTACNDLARQARMKPWWKEYDAVIGEYIALETEATIERSWQPLLVPGLLQTAAYAREIFAVGRHGSSTRLIELQVKARLARQDALLNCDLPVQLHALLGEQALHRRIGTHDIMREQLERLTLISNRPNLTLQVLEETVGAHPGLSGSFVLLSLPGGADYVYFETPLDERVADRIDTVREYERRFDHLAALALTPEKSAALISDILKEL
ncbi:helix-turn-helix domain-containing protein [Nonomuraea sp. NPDC050556]|uniref:helix-turn-helix domain-containing protein n=1 Tax=Nonomuraea sp. NPDC050556 TaxID=3364369 RepID=UPI0037926BAB